ncbi:hypothetical protein LCGC14_2455370, partial [marine sediment metagenome]
FIQLDSLIDDTRGLSDKILIGQDNIARDILDDIQATQDLLFSFIQDTEDDIRDEIDRSEGKIISGLDGLTLEIAESVPAITKLMQERIDEQDSLLQKESQGVIDSVTDKIGDTFEVLKGLSEDIFEKTKELLPDLSNIVDSVVDKLPELAEDIFFSTVAKFFGPLGTLFEFFGKAKFQQELKDLDPFFKAVEDDPDGGEHFEKFTKTGFPAIILGAVGAIVGVVVMFPAQMVTNYFHDIQQKIIQNSLSRGRPTLLDTGSVLELRRREGIPDEEVTRTLDRKGFTDADQTRIKALGNNLLGIGEVIDLWRRKELTRDEAETRIGKLGFDETDRDHILTLGFGIPPIQDLITMAVREAFQLDVAERFGQLEGLPEHIRAAFDTELAGFGSGVEGSIGAFAEFAGRQGIAPQWIAAYWAAHWREPGVNQLFEMVHRLQPDLVDARREGLKDTGLDPEKLPFTLDDLQIALQKQDITPFWRGRLTAIAFRPLTRVDIRRMHKLGVMDREEVKRRYRE